MHRKRFATLIVLASLVAMALVGVAVVSPTGANAPTERGDSTITVSATGEASAPPDRALVRVAVTATGDDAGTVREDIAADADALREALADAGVAEGAYETTEYRIAEPRRPPERRDGPAPAYRGVHGFEVTLSDPDRTGAVVDAAVDAGAEIDGVEFTLSDAARNELRGEAIEVAMADARSQAETIARNGDLRVTGVRRVDASQRRFSPVRYDAEAGDAAAPSESALDGGDVSVTYEVTVGHNATSVSP